MSVARWPILSRCFSTVTPVGVARDDEGGQAAVARRPCRSRRRRPIQAAWPAFVMNIFEPLRTYSSPLAHRRRLDARDVGAGVRLGERERAEERLLEQRRQPLPLLLLGAGEQHRQRAEDVGDDRRRRSRSSPSRAPRRSARRRSRRGRDRRAPPGCAGSSARPRAPSRSRRPDASGARRTRPPSAGSPSRRTRARARAAPSARPSARRRLQCHTVSSYRAHTCSEALID